MLVVPTNHHTEERPMRTSIRHLSQSVERLLTASAVDLPRRTRQRLLFLIVGLLLSGSLVLRRIACTQAYLTPQTCCAASHERRLRRVIGDPLITWERSYARVVRRLLERHRPRQWLILLDESGHTDRLRVLTAALWYRGRAIPLAWVYWPGQTPQTTSYWSRCSSVLDQVATLLPKGAAVLVVADRAFGCPVFTDPIAARGWEWLVRVQGQTRFRDQVGRIEPLRTQVAAAGQRWKGRGFLFKDAGWREASAVALWGRAHREPLLLVSSLPLSWDLVALYKKRAAIEALFRDWKSSGWQWEQSQVSKQAHQERLLLGLAFATLLTLLLGTSAAAAESREPSRRSRRRRWSAAHSLFRLGREAFWQRLWRGERTPIAWELAELDGPNWSAQRRTQPAPAPTRIGCRVV
jgi:Transposase DDE domain